MRSTPVFPDMGSGATFLPVKAAVHRAERIDDDSVTIHVAVLT
jgi:hypothetical protein